jgi:hypothetical protein
MEIWLAGGIILLLAMLGGDKNGASDGGEGDGKLPPDKDPTPSTVPSRRRGAGGRGQVWSSDAQTSSLPSAGTFDYSGNGLWIDPECGFVIEGDLFWPKKGAKSYAAIEAPTLDATLAARRDNTVLGFVDYLVDTLGYAHPENVVWEIVKQAAPMCEQVDPAQWGEAMRIWFNDFLRRVTTYMNEDTIGGFG